MSIISRQGFNALWQDRLNSPTFAETDKSSKHLGVCGWSLDRVAACMAMLGSTTDFVEFCLAVVPIGMIQEISTLTFPCALATKDFAMSENVGDEALFSAFYFPPISSFK